MRTVYVDESNVFHPLTKIAVTLLLGFTPFYSMNSLLSWLIVALLALAFCLEKEFYKALKALIVFALLSFLQSNYLGTDFGPLTFLISFAVILKVLYLPLLAAEWLISTTDVGSLLAAFAQIKVPQAVSIPLAVMFRFFPAFKEEVQEIRQAMKVRGISLKQPLQYLESLAVPLLISASRLADDLAEAAETKGIMNPVKKTHYRETSFKFRDILYIVIILAVMLGGMLCLN